VTDYGELAQKLSNQRSHAQSDQEAGADRGMDATQIYESVKVHASNEIEKANVELRKRKLAIIERLFLPSFRGRLCLSFGSAFMCTADLHEARGQITAVLLGPPNQQEISRKDFALNEYRPERIAVEIVSGLLMGEFS
jgi:hypothetical protein